MIHYRKILELHDEGISHRGIAASTGHSRQKITEVITLAEKKGVVCPLEEEMTDQWIEEFLFYSVLDLVDTTSINGYDLFASSTIKIISPVNTGNK